MYGLQLGTLLMTLICSIHLSSQHTVTECEASSMTLNCPSGTSIHITDALYGRRNEVTCQHQSMHNTNCGLSIALDRVRRACENELSCTFIAGITFFEIDPCFGTYKYTTVNYECVTDVSSRQTVTECENTPMTLRCPSGSSIHINDVLYGRMDRVTCPHQSIHNINCKLATGLALVRRDCEGEQSCAFTAGITYFHNDPCYGTYKYTTVNYVCVQE